MARTSRRGKSKRGCSSSKAAEGSSQVTIVDTDDQPSAPSISEGNTTKRLLVPSAVLRSTKADDTIASVSEFSLIRRTFVSMRLPGEIPPSSGQSGKSRHTDFIFICDRGHFLPDRYVPLELFISHHGGLVLPPDQEQYDVTSPRVRVILPSLKDAISSALHKQVSQLNPVYFAQSLRGIIGLQTVTSTWVYQYGTDTLLSEMDPDMPGIKSCRTVTIPLTTWKELVPPAQQTKKRKRENSVVSTADLPRLSAVIAYAETYDWAKGNQDGFLKQAESVDDEVLQSVRTFWHRNKRTLIRAIKAIPAEKKHKWLKKYDPQPYDTERASSSVELSSSLSLAANRHSTDTNCQAVILPQQPRDPLKKKQELRIVGSTLTSCYRPSVGPVTKHSPVEQVNHDLNPNSDSSPMVTSILTNRSKPSLDLSVSKGGPQSVSVPLIPRSPCKPPQYRPRDAEYSVEISLLPLFTESQISSMRLWMESLPLSNPFHSLRQDTCVRASLGHTMLPLESDLRDDLLSDVVDLYQYAIDIWSSSIDAHHGDYEHLPPTERGTPERIVIPLGETFLPTYLEMVNGGDVDSKQSMINNCRGLGAADFLCFPYECLKGWMSVCVDLERRRCLVLATTESDDDETKDFVDDVLGPFLDHLDTPGLSLRSPIATRIERSVEPHTSRATEAMITILILRFLSFTGLTTSGIDEAIAFLRADHDTSLPIGIRAIIWGAYNYFNARKTRT